MTPPVRADGWAARGDGGVSWHLETTHLSKVLAVSVQADSEILVTSVPKVDEGDHERFAHIVLEGYTPKNGDFVPLENSVVAGMINGSPVRALCGKVWVPGRDPQKFPICPTCKEIAESMGWKLPGG